jgi:peptidoglycan/xylan/chitin deacetylase (PgdA/CDA1 family)
MPGGSACVRSSYPNMSVYRAHRTWTTALRRIGQRRSVILGYHGVARCPRKDDLFLLQLPPSRLRAQLEMMLEAGFRFVTVAELAAEAGGKPPTPGIAAVSFDDAMQNLRTAALPILQELGIRATVYVPTDWLGGRSPWIGPGGDGAILTEEELRELAAAGWELGLHTLSHADLSQLDYDGCRREIDGSRAALERIAGVRAETLAYPYGHYGPAAVQAARDAGLRAAVTTGSGSWEPFELTRAMVGAADPFPVVLLKLTDRYEPLLRSRPLRAVRDGSKVIRDRIGERRRDRAGGRESQ